MNHLIAKVKGKANYCKMKSGDDYYGTIDLSDNVQYDPRTTLEDGQWFVIPDFSNKEYCLQLLKDTWDSTEYEIIDKSDIEKVDYICAYQNNDEFCFQRVLKNTRFLGRKLLSIGDNVEFKANENIIEIKSEPDAIYKKGDNCLYFRRLETVTPIFRGIESLYKEATAEEVDYFLNQDFVCLAEGYNVEKVGKANRKRLAVVNEKMKKLTKEEKASMLEYTVEYFPDMKTSDGQLIVSSENDFKLLMFGLDERLYTTPVTKEQRAASSVISLTT